jgi:hypothetical protein
VEGARDGVGWGGEGKQGQTCLWHVAQQHEQSAGTPCRMMCFPGIILHMFAWHLQLRPNMS